MILGIDRPLRVGEVLAEAVRLYGKRPLVFILIGMVEAVTHLLFAVLPLALALFLVAVVFVACFALTVSVAVEGDLRRAVARVIAAAPTVLALGLVVGVPTSLGVLDVGFLLIAVLWLGFVSSAVPAAVLDDERNASPGRALIDALRRGASLGQASLLHSILVVFVLIVATTLLTVLLGTALNSFGDQTQIAALVIARGVLLPILFLGLTALYAEQLVRIGEETAPRRARA